MTCRYNYAMVLYIDMYFLPGSFLSPEAKDHLRQKLGLLACYAAWQHGDCMVSLGLMEMPSLIDPRLEFMANGKKET